MDIKEAIATVAELKQKIKQINEMVAGAGKKYGDRSARISITVWVEGKGDEQVSLKREDAIGLLESTRAGLLAEIDRLQPIIDMANLALKGLEKQA